MPDMNQIYEMISLNGPPHIIQILRNTDLTFCGWRAENFRDGSPEVLGSEMEHDITPARRQELIHHRWRHR